MLCASLRFRLAATRRDSAEKQEALGTHDRPNFKKSGKVKLVREGRKVIKSIEKSGKNEALRLKLGYVACASLRYLSARLTS